MSVQVKSSGSSPTLQSRTVTPSSSTQYITAQTGYDALSQVTVQGDSNLVSSNIKSGVSIFGVSGNVNAIGQKHKIRCMITSVSSRTQGRGTINFTFKDFNSSYSIDAANTSFFTIDLQDSSGSYEISVYGAFYRDSTQYFTQYLFTGNAYFLIARGSTSSVFYQPVYQRQCYLNKDGSGRELDVSSYSEWKSYYSSASLNQVSYDKNEFFY